MSAPLPLNQRDCVHGAPALDAAAIAAQLAQVPDWRVADGRLVREFLLRDYLETIAFANALAWMAQCQDHHPVLTLGYRCCEAAWTTHSAGNRLSDNDFICAARADALYAGRAGA